MSLNHFTYELKTKRWRGGSCAVVWKKQSDNSHLSRTPTALSRRRVPKFLAAGVTSPCPSSCASRTIDIYTASSSLSPNLVISISPAALCRKLPSRLPPPLSTVALKWIYHWFNSISLQLSCHAASSVDAMISHPLPRNTTDLHLQTVGEQVWFSPPQQPGRFSQWNWSCW